MLIIMAAKSHSPDAIPVPLTDDALLELGRQALQTEAQAVRAPADCAWIARAA